MEPFPIICQTCAAKLKVRHASAVGQKLACPKCGDMVMVTAPEGRKLPENNDSTKAANESSESDFEDIDQILQTKSVAQKGPPTKPKPQKPAAQKTALAAPRVQVADTPTAPATAPMLPNDNWTNEATKKRRNLLIACSVAFAVLLIGGAIYFAVSSNRSNETTPEVVDLDNANDDSSKPSSNHESVEKAVPDNAGSTDIENDIDPSENNAAETSANTKTSTNAESDSINDLSVEDSATHTSDHTTVQTETDSPPSLESDATNDRTEQIKKTADSPEQESTPPAPFRSDLDEILNPISAGVDDVKTNFDALSAELESRGSSLFDLNQWAALNSDRRRIGLPKYFIKRPSTLNNSDPQLLTEPVLGAQLSDHTFLQLIAEFTQITGVPISFDTNNDFFDRFDFGFALVDFKQTNSTYAGVIQAALQTTSDQLQLSLNDNLVAIIETADGTALESAQLDMPTLQSKTPEQFILLTKQMVAPGSWNDEENRTLTLEQGALKVQHYPPVVSQLRQLTQKWELARAVKDGSKSVEVIASRWTQTQLARSQALDLQLENDTPILEWAVQLQEKSKTNLLFDFSSIQEQGWNPNTKIPMNFSEPNVDKLLTEVSHSMDIAYRAVNPNTFEFLTRQKLAEIQEVEIYYCGDILKTNLNRAQTTEIVRQALQSANRLDGSCRVYFENDFAGFIVVGSQDAQRLIESVLDRLRDL